MFLLMNIFGWITVSKTAVNIFVQVFLKTCFYFSDKFLRVDLLDQRGGVCLIL